MNDELAACAERLHRAAVEQHQAVLAMLRALDRLSAPPAPDPERPMLNGLATV